MHAHVDPDSWVVTLHSAKMLAKKLVEEAPLALACARYMTCMFYSVLPGSGSACGSSAALGGSHSCLADLLWQKHMLPFSEAGARAPRCPTETWAGPGVRVLDWLASVSSGLLGCDAAVEAVAAHAVAALIWPLPCPT